MVSLSFLGKAAKAALLLTILGCVFNVKVAHANTAFQDEMLDGYKNMPTSLPDDRGLYPGSTGLSASDHHQYVTVAGGNIDDAGGNTGGNDFRRAGFVVYSTSPVGKELTVTFVDRAVNISGGESKCDGTLEVRSLDQSAGPTGGQFGHNKFINNKSNDDICGRSVTSSDPEGTIIPNYAFTEIKPLDANGNPVSSGIYKAYINVYYRAGSGSQVSFRISSPGARMGFTDGYWANMYATKLANGHTMSFKWRPPCGGAAANESGRIFAYGDGDQGNPSIQPNSAGATRDRIRAGSVLGTDTLRDYEQVVIGHQQAPSGVWYSEGVDLNNINGGNGITFNLPYESGNYYFRTCPPPPNSGELVGTCENYSPKDIWPRDSVFNGNATRYKIYAFSGVDGNNNPTGFLGASGGVAGGPAAPFLGTNTPGSPADNAQPWAWPDESIDGRTIYYTVDSYRWDANSGGMIGIENSSVMHFTFNCGDPPPSWYLQSYSGVTRDYVELGDTVSFDHSVYNRGPNTATGVAGGVKANYNINNPGTGAVGGANDTNNVFGVDLDTIDPGDANARGYGPYPVPIDPNATNLLGQTYCQRFYINPSRMVNGSITEGETQSDARCAVVVGGKSGVGVSATPKEAEPEDTITFSINITTNNYSAGGGWNGYDANCSYQLYANGGAVGGMGGSCSQHVNGNGTLTVPKAYTVPSGMAIGTQLCMVANMGTANTAFQTKTSDQDCAYVRVKPYFKVYGGDISAGNGFSGVCLQNSSVIGWNTNSAARGFRGSGAQYAIYAQNVIKGVAPAQNIPAYGDLRPYTPSKLGFANTIAMASDEYGGQFGSGSCSNDYYSGMPADDTNVWTNLADTNNDTSDFERNFKANGPLTLKGVAEDPSNIIQRGNNTRLYVNGDVYITSNIVAQAGAESVDQIPNFMLIVKGNIYIDPSVTSLYGTYIAQPDGSAGGEIYTCANQFAAFSAADVYSRCRSQLQVTGAFVAKKLNLQRSNGSLYMDKDGNAVSGSGQANAAEIFQYNPLMWLRQSTSTHTTNNDTWDAVSTLPPVL